MDNIRKKETKFVFKKEWSKLLLVLLLGVILGIFSKWLDELAINDSIWWQKIIGILDLGNFFSNLGIWLFIALILSIYSKNPIEASIKVFLFFLGMNVSYHLYTIYVGGFNPKYYMLGWYTLTLISPLIAYITWYSKSNNKIVIILNSIILFVMLKTSFSMGMWYFSFNNILDTLVFLGVNFVMYKNLKISGISLLIALIFAFILRIPYLG